MKLIHLLGLAAIFSAPAYADTITTDTFSFTQGGYTGLIFPGSTGTLSGTFTGTVEANGTIQLADLSAIHIQYTAGGTSLFGYGPASFFSYNPTFGGSTLDVETAIGVNGFACVGAVAAFGYGHCGAGGVNGEVAGLDTTQQLAAVTLISSVTTIVIPPQPLPIPGPVPEPAPNPNPIPIVPISPVPEPESLVLLGSAMMPLAWALRRSGILLEKRVIA